jgi:hypothetical protein
VLLQIFLVRNTSGRPKITKIITCFLNLIQALLYYLAVHRSLWQSVNHWTTKKKAMLGCSSWCTIKFIGLADLGWWPIIQFIPTSNGDIRCTLMSGTNARYYYSHDQLRPTIKRQQVSGTARARRCERPRVSFRPRMEDGEERQAAEFPQWIADCRRRRKNPRRWHPIWDLGQVFLCGRPRSVMGLLFSLSFSYSYPDLTWFYFSLIPKFIQWPKLHDHRSRISPH